MNLAAWLILIDLTLRLLLALRVLLRRAPVPVRLAWIVLLAVVPFISWVVYIFIGEKNLGLRRAEFYEECTSEIEVEAVQLMRERLYEWTEVDISNRALVRLGNRVSGIPPLRGNELELLVDTAETMDRLIADINAAERSVHMLYYIWMHENIGVRMAEAVAAAAKRGVKCRVLVDDVGSADFIKYGFPERLRECGVEVVAALPVNPLRSALARLDLRNHRKICVIDGRVAYVGSHNIIDQTFDITSRRGVGPWVDASLRVRGPAVHALQTVFLRDWSLDAETTRPNLRDLVPEDDAPIVGGKVLHVIPSGPCNGPVAIRELMLAMIHMAREEIVMTTPYFVPDEAALVSLQVAARRGVEVTLIVPERHDTRIVEAASRAMYQELLDAGVRIYHYKKGLLHAKTFTIDRKLGVITSANFDVRSFFLNFEITMVVHDQDFAGQLRFMQKSFESDSVQLDAETWRRRPLHRRLIESAAELGAPLL